MDRTWSGAGDTVPLMQQTRAAPPATLDAVLERITYANQETGYTVARVAIARSSDLLTVVGPLLGAQPGESLRLRGRWASHPQYGRQFQVEAYTTVLPATIQGIRRYLGSGLIKGIGPKMAERIVDHFGQATLEVIEQAPGRLVEVPGLGPKRTAMITAAWAEQQAIKEVMVFLQGMGVSTSLNLEGAAVAHKRPSGVKPRRSLPQLAGRSRLVPPQSLGAPPGC
jgi:exodeoxyribonuclease V alpha subunit